MTTSFSRRFRYLRSVVIPFVVISATLLTNAYFVLLNKEWWPFTSAPMFGPAVTLEQPRYSFQFVAICADGKQRNLRPSSLGLHWAFHRYFFKYVYGAASSRSGINPSPYAEFPNDTPEHFEARMTAFFKKLSELAERYDACRSTALNSIELLLREEKTANVKRVGRFSRMESRFALGEGA